MGFQLGRPFEVVNLAKVEVIIGGLLGITLVLVFTGWAMAAVGRAAQAVVQEVRRQFRDRPGILTGMEHEPVAFVWADRCIQEPRSLAILPAWL